MEEVWSFRYSKTDQPEGPLVELSAAEMERRLLAQLDALNSDKADGLWQLARFYAGTKQRDKAMEYLRQIMALQSDPENKAATSLAMGQTAEHVHDYESAIRFYKEAFAMEPTATGTWYFIHNNLGYCLNTLGRFAEGEAYCRKAVEIDGQRHNAFKNLGIALEAQGQFTDAARCFVTATKVNASDRRAYDLLENLLTGHPELLVEFDTDAEVCRKAVEFAANERARAAPVVQRGWRKQLILLRLKLKDWFKKLSRR
jgi:tetratricopeptide (TPR) repeat protein